MLNIEHIKASYERIQSHIRKTGLKKSSLFEDVELYLKLENEQFTNSFKLRGVMSKLTSMDTDALTEGVMTVSSGNHGAAVSYASKLLGINNANIIVPACTPQSKMDNIKKYGANVLIMGQTYDEAHDLGEQYQKENNLTYIDAYYEDLQVYAGQGTLGLEILEQAQDIDILLVPVGGGGLITGIATAVKAISPHVKVIGMQTSACPAMIHAMRDNTFYETYPSQPNICDALVGGIGKRAFEMMYDSIDDIIEVEESNILSATRKLYKVDGVIAEPSSALFVSAIENNLSKFVGKKVAAVISGGNIDKTILTKIKEEI